MAYVLALLASGRKKGFTATLLQAAAAGAASVEGVEVEVVHLHQYRFGPCKSCFNCIRDPEHQCGQHDAMGGAGELMAKVRRAKGWILADPVHFWGPSAQAHLFIERCYPFLWSGALQGMPLPPSPAPAIRACSAWPMRRCANPPSPSGCATSAGCPYIPPTSSGPWARPPLWATCWERRPARMPGGACPTRTRSATSAIWINRGVRWSPIWTT
ncbi:MAG: flavodoxin family protein [Candidatus Latescibacteria bacterium]|nr:flavodoxin family protein [Candidatus Latescibacterota bacterium]